MRSITQSLKAIRGRPHRFVDSRAASDNVTHGTWIIAAVALGALLVGTLAVPGGPAHHWLTCNVHSITDISGSQTATNTCDGAPKVNGPMTVTSFSPDNGSVTSSTLITITGTNLPVYHNSQGIATTQSGSAGYLFPNFMFMADDDGDGWPAGNSLEGTDYSGITIVSSSSTLLTFYLNGFSYVPDEIFLSDQPIVRGEAPNAGSATPALSAPF